MICVQSGGDGGSIQNWNVSENATNVGQNESGHVGCPPVDSRICRRYHSKFRLESRYSLCCLRWRYHASSRCSGRILFLCHFAENGLWLWGHARGCVLTDIPMDMSAPEKGEEESHVAHIGLCCGHQDCDQGTDVGQCYKADKNAYPGHF